MGLLDRLEQHLPPADQFDRYVAARERAARLAVGRTAMAPETRDTHIPTKNEQVLEAVYNFQPEPADGGEEMNTLFFTKIAEESQKKWGQNHGDE